MNEAVAVKPSRGCPPGAAVVEMPNGSRIGNPPHEPTEASRTLVRTLTKFMPHEMIADELGIHPTTMYKYYRDELGAGKREVIKALGSKAITKAMAGDNQMIMFYLKAFGGWNEPRRHEVTGPGGGPIQTVDLTSFYRGLSADDFELAGQLLARIAAELGASATDIDLTPDGAGRFAAVGSGEAPPPDGGPAG